VRIATSTAFKNACALIELWFVLYLTYVLLVAVHEMGHLLAARACGFRVKEFRVSCLRWRDGWGLDWRGIHLLSGWVNARLTRPDDVLRFRYLLFTVAGPLANLICAALLYPIAVHPSTLGGIAKYLFLGNIIFAVANLIPIKARTLESDGLQIFSTLFDRKGFEALRFHIRCQEAAPTLQGLRDKDDWLGVKQLVERLLALSAGVRAKEEVVKSLDTILRFADGQLAEAAIADGAAAAK
jgi:membrane-associated protease RseP (regulator of RpoE activity)